MTLDRHDIGLDAATSSLLDALSETPAQQLAVLLTQHGASLPVHTQRALHILASQAVNDLVPPQPGSASHAEAERVVGVLRRLIARGDPSQARRLVPTSAALVDLALCCNDARDVLARLVDEQSAEALLRAAGMAYEQAEASRSPKQIARAAFVLARLLNSLPIWTHTSVSAGRKGLQQTSSRSAVYPTSKETMKLLTSLQRNYSSFDVKEPISSAGREHLMAKMALLDATWSLLERQSHSGFKASSVAEMDKLLHTAAASKTASTPLVDLDLLADLALVKPSVIEMLRTSVPHSSSLDVLVQQVTRITEASGAELGAGWSRVASMLRVSTQAEVANPSQHSDEEHVELISMIVAILPQWEGRVPQLQVTLREARFAGQSDDMIVQMLMDEGAEPAIAAEETNDAMELLRQRANVFDDDDEALRKATLLRGGAKGKRRAQQDVELSDDIKAAILARANAPDSDEEDALGWNPFADEAALEVGFEEELGDDDEIHQAGRNVLAPRRTAEEGSDTEEGEADGRHAGAGHGTRMYEPSPTASGSPTPTTTTDASDRAAERVLIEAWKEGGELQFGKESRKSKTRTELLARVNNVSTTKRWDDQLLESWATMFSRNPLKDKLLAAADDILRFGNPNHRPVQLGDDKDGHEARGFGPDRGRGGRVYGPSRGTGGRGGERGGRGRGGGKSRGGRGGGARGQSRGGGGAAGGGGTRA